MEDRIMTLFEDIIDIDEIRDYQFHEVFGFTFVFKKKIIVINDMITSGEIKPIAIIYEENGEYYLAPIDVVDEIDEVIKEFVKQQLQSKN